MKKIRTFFKGIKKEIKMIKWPTFKETISYSCVVVAMLLFFSLFFYGFDVLFAFLKGLVK